LLLIFINLYYSFYFYEVLCSVDSTFLFFQGNLVIVNIEYMYLRESNGIHLLTIVRFFSGKLIRFFLKKSFEKD